MLRKILPAALLSVFFTSAAAAETSYIGCNIAGLDRMTPNQATRVFTRRVAERGLGNGEESFDVTINPFTGDIVVACRRTANEQTGGHLFFVFDDGTLIDLGEIVQEQEPNGR